MQRVSLPSRLLGFGALLLVIATLVVLLLSSSRPAYANIFTVNTESDLVDSDPGDGACDVLGFGICSLRAAVMESNALDGDDLIILPQGTYVLTIAGADENDAASGDLDVGGFDSLTIEGGGTGSTLISGAGLDRVFHVLFFAELELQDLIVDGGAVVGTGGGISNSGTLRLIRVNVANNKASEEGGGIYNRPATTGFFGAAGTITLTDSAVFSNTSAEAGGIFNGGSATITDSSIHLNAATVDSGGGITNQGTLTLSNATIVDNTTPGFGGGIANEGTLNSTDSNFDRNTAKEGGGIWISAGASLTLTGGGLFNNEATERHGGGILNFGDAVISSATLESNRSSMLDGGALYSSGTLTIKGSTLSGNSARAGGGIGAFGAVDVTDSTIRMNSAQERGGGLWSNGATTIDHTILSNNSAGTDGGAIAIIATTMTLRNSQLIDNSAGKTGGGLYSAGAGADVSVSKSSFTGNQAAAGGGIATDLGSLTLTDSTVDGNTTTGSGGGIGGDGFVTISGGSVSNNTVSVGDGGGISSGGTLIASGTIVSGNSARSGGGIDEAGATTLTNLTISENDAAAGGGAIRSRGSLTLSGGALTNNTASFGGGLSIGVTGAVSLTATTISGNRAQRDGGGIINLGGILTVLATQINENVTLELGGGGIVNREGGVATISDSTISDNVGGLDAGGIFNGIDGASLTLLRSTVSGNQAGLGGGGAILNVDGALSVTNSTISGNSAAGPGGGVLIRGDGSLDALNATITENRTLNVFGAGVEVEGGSARLQNSLVAANFPADCAGPVDSLGHNLDSDDTCQLDGVNDLAGRDPRLGPLADNGGPTPTQPLLPGSPAIDAALDIIAPAVDQRGLGRLRQADIGAFEFQDDAAPAQLVLNLSLGWESLVYTGSNGMLASELADLIGPALTIMLRFDAGQGTWLTFRPDAPIPQLNTLSALNQGDALFLRLSGPATLTLPDLLPAGATSAELGPGFTFVGFTGAGATELADLLALLPAITGAFVWGQPAQAWLAFRPGQPIFLSGVTSVDRLTGIFLFNASGSAQTLTWDQVAAP